MLKIIWFTGLSGSGKTALALLLLKSLKSEVFHFFITLLILRKTLKSDVFHFFPKDEVSGYLKQMRGRGERGITGFFAPKSRIFQI